jgi:hypothetical protein
VPLFVAIGRLRVTVVFENDENHLKVITENFDKVCWIFSLSLLVFLFFIFIFIFIFYYFLLFIIFCFILCYLFIHFYDLVNLPSFHSYFLISMPRYKRPCCYTPSSWARIRACCSTLPKSRTCCHCRHCLSWWVARNWNWRSPFTFCGTICTTFMYVAHSMRIYFLCYLISGI